ncbi:GNAT family N-acetyltransferase [Neorhizobium sp. JUb45]|uniref:GNAT family N-acetyltransferase n=1 Tax=unclassified Neorhizobium TaxID=2629175 RepID=UPI0010E6C111|nr:GNAT family N-acetyltransferase [Neorhizobium sp. JUb45]TCR04558.1 CelD/BcsL family acetyltransferase involved in cellulose biosynthesis [Neorhizobium sp. JUb45]
MQRPQTDFETVLDTTAPPAGAYVAPPPFPLANLRLDLVARMEDIEADWRRLEALPRNSLHQAYDWCHAWHMAHQTPLLLVRGRIDGRTVLILPLETVHESGGRIARFLGGRFNNINSGLLDDDFRYLDGEAVQAIAAMLKALLKGHVDLLALETIPLMWRDVAHPLTGLHAIEDANRTFQLPLLPSFEETLAQVNAKRRRKKFRVQQRRLQEKGGYEHVIARTAEEKHALLETFFEQKAARFRLHGLPDVFQAPEKKAFFRSLMNVSERGSDTPLELHAIRLKGEHDGKIAAISGLSRKGDHVICQFGSIDDTLVPEASPGELLFWLMIERACQTGAALFDFGVGDQPYKRSWCTVETITHDLLLPISVRGWLMMHLLAAKIRATGAIKRNKALYGWLQGLRAGRQAPQPAPAEND